MGIVPFDKSISSSIYWYQLILNLCLIQKRELTIQAYIQTAEVLRFPKRSEIREFGKVYERIGDVYIKIRAELLSDYGNHTTFVMSFHYAEVPFSQQGVCQVMSTDKSHYAERLSCSSKEV